MLTETEAVLTETEAVSDLSGLVAPDGSLVALEGAVQGVDFISLGGFRRASDLQIASCLRGRSSSDEARDAAAELSRDCGALAVDLALAGASPSPAWGDVIQDDRSRAIASLQRLVSALPECGRIDPKTGVYQMRPGSVPMRRKTAHH
jgi:hypothetical protein